MKTLVVLLAFFLIMGLFVRNYNARTSLVLMTFIIGMVLYMTLR